MKANFKLKIFLFFSVGLKCLPIIAHDVPVHRNITANAETSAFAHSSSYADFISTISSDRSRISQPDQIGLTNSLIDGSAREDGPFDGVPKEAGGYRSLNHFYDPIYANYGRGLSDSPFLLVAGGDSRDLIGTNSFAWASVSNCAGITKQLLLNVNPINTWSWQNGRGYEWLGLTATDLLGRQTNLDNMFRAVGQVMHLLEDTSQPQHIRNK